MTDRQTFHHDDHILRFEEATEPPPMRNTIDEQKQRAALNFDLQSEPAPPGWRGLVQVSVYPQDPFVDEPVVRTMPAQELRAGVLNDRFRISDSRGLTATPSAQGDYLFPPTQAEFDQINALYYATLTLRMCEYYAGRSLPWTFGLGQLVIDPCAGTTEANAFYHESKRMVAFFNQKRGRREVRSAQSSDIVTHEVGHAILDGLRDLLNRSFSFGPEAFHEAFCDMMAILVALHDNGLIERIIQFTDGNLRLPSFLPKIAEELAHTRTTRRRSKQEREVFYLRSALNNFTAQKFEKLPYLPEDPLSEVGREAHSYSRVYTGALYDILVAIYDRFKKQWSAPAALAMARDVVGRLLIRSVELGPVGESSFEDFAWSMLAADRLFMGGAYSDVISAEMIKRKILSRSLIKRFTEQAATIPPLILPENVRDTDSALEFLGASRKALGLPETAEFYTQSGYKDAEGNLFLTYVTATTMILDAAHGRHAGQTIALFGGLVLIFGPDRCLRHACFRPVTDEDLGQAHTQIGDMLRTRHLALGLADGEGAPVLERQAILTVGSERRPSRQIIEVVNPEFTPVARGPQPALADLLPGVIRVNMHTADQLNFEAYVDTMLQALGLRKNKKRNRAK